MINNKLLNIELIKAGYIRDFIVNSDIIMTH